MSRLPALFAATVVTLAIAACSSNREPQTGPISGRMEPAEVRVTNNNWLDVAVYASAGSKQIRLGTVTTMNTENFSVPRTLVSGASSLRLIANPIGATDSFTTESVNIWPGQTVLFRIENQLAISNVTVQ